MAAAGKDEGGFREQYADMSSADRYRSFRPDPLAHAKSLGYSEAELEGVPADAVMSLGCGNPTAFAELKPGEVVLDLGCGGGLDAFLAARRVGPAGRVIGVDMTPEMVERAAGNAARAHIPNVEFKCGTIECLPLEDASVDVAISNCVINHCADKVAAFREIWRVLRPGGRMHVADLVVAGPFSEDALRDELWGEWLRRAAGRREYLDAIAGAGFNDIAVVAEGAFAMSEKDERLRGKIISLHVRATK